MIPVRIWQLRVLLGESECFLFLAWWTGMLLHHRGAKKKNALTPFPIMHGVQHGPPPPFCPLLDPPADSLLSLRMLQQLVEHLRLLHVGAAAGGGAHRILRYHWLGLQVHGVVAVRRERRRGRHVAHVLRRHGPDHVGICKTSQGRREVRVGGASLPAVRRGRRTFPPEEFHIPVCVASRPWRKSSLHSF